VEVESPGEANRRETGKSGHGQDPEDVRKKNGADAQRKKGVSRGEGKKSSGMSNLKDSVNPMFKAQKGKQVGARKQGH